MPFAVCFGPENLLFLQGKNLLPDVEIFRKSSEIRKHPGVLSLGFGNPRRISALRPLMNGEAFFRLSTSLFFFFFLCEFIFLPPSIRAVSYNTIVRRLILFKFSSFFLR